MLMLFSQCARGVTRNIFTRGDKARLYAGAKYLSSYFGFRYADCRTSLQQTYNCMKKRLPSSLPQSLMAFDPYTPRRTVRYLSNGVHQHVLSIEAVTDIIKENLGIDMCVISVPPSHSLMSADYLIVVSGRSSRHLRLMAHSLSREFKHEAKRNGINAKPSVNGEGSDDWIVADIGNIVVHLMLPETREMYDLESLWVLGPEFDEKYRQIELESQLDKKYVWKTLPSDQSSVIAEENMERQA